MKKFSSRQRAGIPFGSSDGSLHPDTLAHSAARSNGTLLLKPQQRGTGILRLKLRPRSTETLLLKPLHRGTKTGLAQALAINDS